MWNAQLIWATKANIECLRYGVPEEGTYTKTYGYILTLIHLKIKNLIIIINSLLSIIINYVHNQRDKLQPASLSVRQI